MNAIYARQSVDRADSISIESQIDFCRYELHGETCQVYADRGYSGKNTDRPAFSELMRQVEAGAIHRVIVYKLDRISRSILDFSNMMERFSARRVEFVSTTEKFDTASPMGRAMLNICIVFAQLERETIQKRVADAYFSRSRKSFYMGGRVPFGFRLVPTCVDGVKTSMYQAVAEEAELIRQIYELYAHPDRSFGDIARQFQTQGILKRGKPWERARLAELVKNPIYVRADRSIFRFYRARGAAVVNAPDDFLGTNGCYCYRRQEADDAEQLLLVLAPHEGIVPAQLWLQCQEKRARTRRTPAERPTRTSWLTGLLRCGVCGRALTVKRSGPGRPGYAYCPAHLSGGRCPGPGTVRLEEMERIVGTAVHGKVQEVFAAFNCKANTPDAATRAAAERLAQAEREKTALTARLDGADAMLRRCITLRLRELEGELCLARTHLADPVRPAAEGSAGSLPAPAWEGLAPEEKHRAAQQLLRAVRAAPGHIQLEWHF